MLFSQWQGFTICLGAIQLYRDAPYLKSHLDTLAAENRIRGHGFCKAQVAVLNFAHHAEKVVG